LLRTPLPGLDEVLAAQGGEGSEELATL
jgi:hypothetical protein